jgi:hypothetical protein
MILFIQPTIGSKKKDNALPENLMDLSGKQVQCAGSA